MLELANMLGQGFFVLICVFCFMLSLQMHSVPFNYWLLMPRKPGHTFSWVMFLNKNKREKFCLIACSVQLIPSWFLTGHMVGIKNLLKYTPFVSILKIRGTPTINLHRCVPVNGIIHRRHFCQFFFTTFYFRVEILKDANRKFALIFILEKESVF